MLFGSPVAQSIVDDLDARGYRRLLDLPAIPVANACGLRYDTIVPVVPGPTDWYLRSFGVGFDLAHRRWSRGCRQWYSLGWGLADRDEVDELLLMQAWEPIGAEANGDLDAAMALVRRSAVRYQQRVDADGWVRVAAVLTGRGGPRVG